MWTRYCGTCFHCSTCWTWCFSLNTAKGDLVKTLQSHILQSSHPSWFWVARLPPMEPTKQPSFQKTPIFCIISSIIVSNFHHVSQNLDSYLQHLFHSFQSSLHFFCPPLNSLTNPHQFEILTAPRSELWY